MVCFLMIRRPPRSTLFPSTTHYRSGLRQALRRVTEQRELVPLQVPAGVPHLAAVGEQRRSEEHTSELQSRQYLVCRLLLEKKSDDQEHHRLTSLKYCNVRYYQMWSN